MPDPAIIGVTITIVSAALGLIWRSASVMTRMELTFEQIKGELGRVSAMGDAVARIPVIETRLMQHDEVLRRAVSDITELRERASANSAITRLSQGDFDR